MPLLTIEEVAQALRVTPRFVRRVIADGRLVSGRVGKFVRISQADLEAFLAAGGLDPNRKTDTGSGETPDPA